MLITAVIVVIVLLYLQYVRIDHETDMVKAMKLLKETWKVEPPNVLISVTGGASNASVDPGANEMLSRLVEVAHNTGNHMS